MDGQNQPDNTGRKDTREITVELASEVRSIRTALFGFHGTNGLRGEVRDLHERIEKMHERIERMEGEINAVGSANMEAVQKIELKIAQWSGAIIVLMLASEAAILYGIAMLTK